MNNHNVNPVWVGILCFGLGILFVFKLMDWYYPPVVEKIVYMPASKVHSVCADLLPPPAFERGV